jgi:hypothetical protein
MTKGFFHEPFAHIYRRVEPPLAIGDRFEVAGMVATVTALTPGRERAGIVEFAFDAPLDGGSFVWVAWKGTRIERIELPAIGEEIELEVTPYMKAMQGS